MTPVAILPSRLKPPATLSPLAHKEFMRIVTSEPAAHFKESDLSLLIQYCEAVALAERAVKELQRDDAPACWLTRWERRSYARPDMLRSPRRTQLVHRRAP